MSPLTSVIVYKKRREHSSGGTVEQDVQFTHRLLAYDGLEAVVGPPVEGFIHTLNLEPHLLRKANA